MDVDAPALDVENTYGDLYTVENNVIVWTLSSANSADSALYVPDDVHQRTDVVFDFKYNTVIAALSYHNGAAISIPSTEQATYNFEANLIDGLNRNNDQPYYGDGFSIASSVPTVNLTRNFVVVYDDWAADNSGNFDTDTDNVWIDGGGDGASLEWTNTVIDSYFNGYDSFDYTFAQTSGSFPSASSVDGVTSMEGSLTAGNANEVGAYANGGYPPLPSES